MSPLRKKLFVPLFCSALCIGANVAHADTIFSEDFQAGKTDAWGATGKGDVRLTTYSGNISMRIMVDGVALTKLSTQGFDNITVTASFAAMSLGANDACVADVSADHGQTWKEVFHIRHGQDDSVTLHSGGGTVAGLENNPKILLRLRTVANGGGATCWADNIKVTGRALSQSAAPTSAFGANGKRLLLTADALLQGETAKQAVDMSAFAPPAKARLPSNRFEGRLTLNEDRAGVSFHVFRDQYGDAKANNGAAQHLPPFDFEFVQSGDALIPMRRGAIPSTHPEWEFILEPGHVWDESGDKGYTRAALPFTLEEKNANCMHNGVLSFLFRNDGAMSDVAYQIGSETCFYFKFDMWGQRAAHYSHASIPNAQALIMAYGAEVAGRMKAKPIAMLAKDHPGIDPTQFGSSSEIDPSDMTVYGLIVDGVHYTSGCATRFGDYPYCDVLDLPSYSVAKSIFAGFATMRLALTYPHIANELIADYVPECAKTGTWNDVTFGNALDMATGHFNSREDQADEEAADIQPFFLAEEHAGKIHFACTHYPRKTAPGTLWVYHTVDMYALGTALNAFYREKAGAAVDFYQDVLVSPVWRKLGLSPVINATRHTYDSVAQPFMAWGLTLHRDDIAKIATFINVDHGAVAGVALLDSHMLMAALQRDPTDTGLRASTNDFRYHNGIWAWNAQSTLGCKAPIWIPFMSGFGGIVVALMPNGVTYYYVSDGGIYAWARAAAEANKIKTFCEK